MTDNGLRRLLYGLVASIAAIAFAVSFDAIQAYAVRVGAFPAALWWAAPLLVDTFTLAGTVAILLRARAGDRAVYAWCLVAAGAGASILINVAHAPATLPARLIAAVPPVALLASLELVMSEQRREQRRRASAEGGVESALATVRSRDLVRELVRNMGAEVDAAMVMDATGVGRRRAYELLAQVRAESNGHQAEGVRA